MASSSGGCSAADEAQMAKLGSGNADGTFPKYLAVCGKQSYLALEHRRSLNPDPKPLPRPELLVAFGIAHQYCFFFCYHTCS